MQWSVEVLNLVDDEDLLIQILDRIGCKIISLDNNGSQRDVLYHQKYDDFESASQVYDDSKNLSGMIQRFSEVDGSPLKIQFGLVFKHNADGSINEHNFVAMGAIVGPLSWGATVMTIRDPEISEEEYQRIIEEAAARAEEQRKEAIVRRAVAALQRSRVLEVMQLMSIPEPTTTELGHIVDLVKDECGGKLRNYASEKQCSRFYHSINSPSVFGLGARHAVGNGSHPANPMSLKEAQDFAHSIGRAWLKEIEESV